LRGGGAFLQGGLRNVRFFGWFFVVKLWWVAGKSWCVDGHFLGSENVPTFSTLFFAIWLNRPVSEIGEIIARLA
jgi:hypothetical protein